MKKQVIYIYFIIGLIIGFFGNQLVFAYKNSKVNKIENLSGSVSYETIYVDGQRYLIFKNASGTDIEVFRK